MGALEDTLTYHQQTKHRPGSYARGPSYLDWSNQPEPWRWFNGATTVRLPLFREREVACNQPVCVDRVAALLERSLAVSAWKEHQGNRWAVRCNPSSGNLHPTEAYVLLPQVEGSPWGAGVYHYRCREHSLEQRCSLAEDEFERLWGMLPEGFVVGLSTIEWREAWKYGERAFRYCHLDLGHAIAAVSYGASTLGLQTTMLCGPTDSEVASILGLDRDEDFEGAEREHPNVLLFLSEVECYSTELPGAEAIDRVRRAEWRGKANSLSRSPTEWKAVSRVEIATRKTIRGWPFPKLLAQSTASKTLMPEVKTLLQRRSAHDFERGKGLTLTQLWSILEQTIPRANSAPWGAIHWQPFVHLALLVHEVQGLEQGIYFLPRGERARAQLGPALNKPWEWKLVESAPRHLPLFRVGPLTARNEAAVLCCGQTLAGDAALVFAMIAEFAQPLKTYGSFAYRRLLWECGAIGQALYLGAESQGLRASALGYFFDDLMLELLGIEGQHWQNLYHLAIGHAIEDSAIVTLPAYAAG